jgi:Tfp pilus assembly protein PilX
LVQIDDLREVLMNMAKLGGKRTQNSRSLRFSEESGAALTLAIMILVTLTLLGTVVLRTSITEVGIAGNVKQYQMAFYAADGGSDLAPHVIRDTFSGREAPDYGSQILLSPGLLDELLNFPTDYNDGPTDSPLANPDIQVPAYTDLLAVEIDVDRNPSTILIPGAGVEFGADYEGIGSGASSGGSGIMYRISSRSQNPRDASSTIRTEYLHIIGVGGS